MKTLTDVFEHTLQDIYYAEQALTKAIPKAERAALHPELKDALKSHLGETEGHVRTLERSGLIHTAKHGRVRRCELRRDRLALVDDWLAEQRRIWEGRTDRLELLVAGETEEQP